MKKRKVCLWLFVPSLCHKPCDREGPSRWRPLPLQQYWGFFPFWCEVATPSWCAICENGWGLGSITVGASLAHVVDSPPSMSITSLWVDCRVEAVDDGMGPLVSAAGAPPSSRPGTEGGGRGAVALALGPPLGHVGLGAAALGSVALVASGGRREETVGP